MTNPLFLCEKAGIWMGLLPLPYKQVPSGAIVELDLGSLCQLEVWLGQYSNWYDWKQKQARWWWWRQRWWHGVERTFFSNKGSLPREVVVFHGVTWSLFLGLRFFLFKQIHIHKTQQILNWPETPSHVNLSNIILWYVGLLPSSCWQN